jgi:hypothetical protein
LPLGVCELHLQVQHLPTQPRQLTHLLTNLLHLPLPLLLLNNPLRLVASLTIMGTCGFVCMLLRSVRAPSSSSRPKVHRPQAPAAARQLVRAAVP